MNRRLTVDLSPLQVYSSALVFSPPSSDLLSLYRASIPSWICKIPVTESRSRFTYTISPDGFRSIISPDGKLLANLTRFGGIEIYSLETGNLDIKLDCHDDQIMDAAFSGDGNRLVTRYWSTITCWDLQTRESYSSYDFDDMPTSQCFSADDHLLVFFTNSEGAYIRDVTDESSHALTEILSERHDELFSPDGKRLIVWSEEEHTIQIFDAATGACLASLPAPNPTLAGNCYFKVVASPDGETVVYAHTFSMRYVEEDEISVHEAIYVRNAVDGEYYVLPTTSRCVSVAFSLDSRYLALASKEEIKIWDLTTRTEYLTISDLGEKLSELEFVGEQLVVFFAFGGIRVLDLEGEIAFQAAQANPAEDAADTTDVMEPNRFPTMSMKSQPSSISFSPDGRYLAAAGENCPVYIWDLSDNSSSPTEIDEQTVQSVCFSPDNQSLACGTNSGSIMIYDVATFDLQYILDGDEEVPLGERAPSLGLCYSPDGTYLVSAGPEVKVWDANERELVNRIRIEPDIERWYRLNDFFRVPAQYLRVGEERFAYMLMAFPLVDLGFVNLEGYRNDASFGIMSTRSLGNHVYPMRSPLAVDQTKWFIMWNEQYLLYVPRDFQADVNQFFAVHSASQTIAIAGRNGVHCFQFDQGSLPTAIRDSTGIYDEEGVPVNREIYGSSAFNLSYMTGQVRQWQRNAREQGF